MVDSQRGSPPTRGRTNSLEADGVTAPRHRINNLMVSLLPPCRTYIYFESRRNASRKYGTEFRNADSLGAGTQRASTSIIARPFLRSAPHPTFFPPHLSGIARRFLTLFHHGRPIPVSTFANKSRYVKHLAIRYVTVCNGERRERW